MQPAGNHRPGSYRSGLASQDEKRGLEGIFRILMVGEDAAADSPDQRPVPVHERREGRVVALLDE